MTFSAFLKTADVPTKLHCLLSTVNLPDLFLDLHATVQSPCFYMKQQQPSFGNI